MKKRTMTWDGRVIDVEDGVFWSRLKNMDADEEEEMSSPFSSVSKVAWPMIQVGATFTMTVGNGKCKINFHKTYRWTRKEIRQATERAEEMVRHFRIEETESCLPPKT